MTGPEDHKQAPKPSPELLRDMERARTNKGPILSQDPELWRKAAEKELEAKVDEAIEFKKRTGMYPWEVPPDDISREQSQWLRNSGIDPDKIREEVKTRMEALIREREKSHSGPRR